MKLAIIGGVAVAGTLAIACAPVPAKVGRDVYAEHCTACHGTSARGDGPLSGDVGVPVPDLTLIAERNGGVFPMTQVMTTIDGYTRRTRGGSLVMPEFGIDLQSGPLVLYDSGDGSSTPTPARLVAIAEYLRTIQR